MEGLRDWDDLRFFLAVARARSVSGAARALGVNHATVSRRIQGFEDRVGARLFERLAGGWLPTPVGEEMLATASRVEEEMHALDRRVAGTDTRLSGKLRVTLSDAAALAVIDDLRGFAEAYPGIDLQVMVSYALTNLTRREADVAIRVTPKPAEHLVGRRVGSTVVSLFGTAGLLSGWQPEMGLDKLPWLGWDERIAAFGGAAWTSEHVPDARLVASFDSVLVAYHAVREGMGVCFLPCALGDRDQTLRRVDPGLLLPGLPIWILTHPDLRDTARVRAFMQFMVQAMSRTRDLREGRRPFVLPGQLRESPTEADPACASPLVPPSPRRPRAR